jgi:hypothetical protein
VESVSLTLLLADKKNPCGKPHPALTSLIAVLMALDAVPGDKCKFNIDLRNRVTDGLQGLQSQ